MKEEKSGPPEAHSVTGRVRWIRVSVVEGFVREGADGRITNQKRVLIEVKTRGRCEEGEIRITFCSEAPESKMHQSTLKQSPPKT